MVLYDFTASSSSATAPRQVCSSATAPTGSSFPMAPCHVPASLRWCPGQSAVLPRRPLAAASRWLSATSLPVCAGVPAGQQFRHGAHWQLLRYGALASNKPHPSERSTPVWLAIWRTWAGFANSQLRCAAFRCNYL